MNYLSGRFMISIENGLSVSDTATKNPNAEREDGL